MRLSSRPLRRPKPGQLGGAARAVAQRAPETLMVARYRAQPTVVTIFRLASTAMLAYLLALLLPVVTPRPVLAPLTALLVAQVTLYHTVRSAIQRVVAVVAGVLVALGLSAWLGFTWWSLTITIAIALAIGYALRLGDTVLEVPISAMLILSVTTERSAAYGRVVETMVGAAAGLLAGLIFARPKVQPAADALDELCKKLASLLTEMSTGLREGSISQHAHGWLAQARSLDGEIHRVDEALRHAEESVRLNPRRVLLPEVGTDLPGGLETLEHAAMTVRLLARLLADSVRIPGGQGPAHDEQIRLRLATVLTELAAAVRVYGRLALEHDPSRRHVFETDLQRHLSDAEARQDQLNELLSIDPAADPAGWPLRGELVSHLDRLRTEVKVGIRTSNQYRKRPRSGRSRWAGRRPGRLAKRSLQRLQPRLHGHASPTPRSRRTTISDRLARGKFWSRQESVTMTHPGDAGNVQPRALRKLLMLSLLLSQQDDQGRILQLAAKATQVLAACRTEGILIDRIWQDIGRRDDRGRIPAADVRCAALPAHGAPVDCAGRAWAWAYPVPAACGMAGCLVVSADREPAHSERFLLQSLAEHVGVALASARLLARERAQAAELRAANLAMRRSMDVHDRLTQVALRGEGEEGIARALYELTEHPAGIEDSFGNLIAWAGPGQPGSCGQGSAESRNRLLGQAMDASGPVRDGDLLISVARLADTPVGVLVLADPDRTAGEAEQVAIAHATTVLAMEVARLQAVSESRARARSSLVLELIIGEEGPGVVNRAQALGYDLGRPHRVVALETCPGAGEMPETELFLDAVRRAATVHRAGSLLAARPNDVILLADAEPSWQGFQAAVVTEAHGAHCRIGVGGRCHELADFPRSYREAQLALRIQKAVGGAGQVTLFDDLGVYQVLATATDAAAMESFARGWLGALLDYDGLHGAQLVRTLSEYLDRGGSYESTSTALSVHRSTLKYRLRRIREVSGYDLSSPDTQFNLQLATRAWRTLEALRSA